MYLARALGNTWGVTKDVFTWTTNDLCGVNRDIIEHSLNVDSSFRKGSRDFGKCHFICPHGWPFGAIANHWSLCIFPICKVVATEVLMKTIYPGLHLIMQFMYPAKSFCIGVHTLASESPYKNTESNNSIGCQLMKVYLNVL
jgi:hypothetical protein